MTSDSGPEGVDEQATPGWDVQVIQTAPDVIRAQDEALIDRQVATAKAYPRSLARFQSELETLVTSDQEFAEECAYRLKRWDSKERKMKKITGPSVRFAEIILSTYEHLFCDTRVIEEALRYVTVEATARDAYKNSVARIQVRRRITTKDGRRFGDDLITLTVNAAISMAMRNAIMRIVPKPIWLPAWRKANEVAAGDSTGFDDRRRKAVEYLTGKGVTEERILFYCRKQSIEDLEIDDVLDLRAVARTEKDTGQDFGELMPKPSLGHDKNEARKGADAAADALRRAGAKPEVDPETGEEIPDHVGRS